MSKTKARNLFLILFILWMIVFFGTSNSGVAFMQQLLYTNRQEGRG